MSDKIKDFSNYMKSLQVSDDIRERRRSICDKCDQKAETLGVDYCKACNCLLDLKTRMSASDCPLKKW